MVIEMRVTKMTSKGQVTIPKKVRERLGVKPGDRLEFKEFKGKYIVEKKIEKSPFDKYVGYLKRKRGLDVDHIIEELRGK